MGRFQKQNAFDVLDRHRNDILSFNDDIEGTAAVAVAGLINACRYKKTKIKDERILIIGAGAAGAGIARLIHYRMMKQGLSSEQAKSKIVLTDSQGMLLESNIDRLEPYKKKLAYPQKDFEKLGISNENAQDLFAVVKAFSPTIIVGTSGQPGVITKEIVQYACTYCENPTIFPFSNPTSLSEAHPKDLIEWSKGKVLTATGSPFDPVMFEGKQFTIGQGNNVFVFPGIGLGAMINRCKLIDQEIFELSAQALADCVSQDQLNHGCLFPSIDQLKTVTHSIVKAIGQHTKNPHIEAQLKAWNWYPEYPEIDIG
ncbi:MAG: oxaloacetate-decarboxylating malate dehydrogenase [Bdellovibrionota bacterium]